MQQAGPKNFCEQVQDQDTVWSTQRV